MSSNNPQVLQSLATDLVRIGLEKGDLVMVHSSFKALGLNGATPADVIHTIMDVLGSEGTLMMPTFSYSYAGIWQVQPFHPDKTPGYGNGVLTETLRAYPGALRSGHPTYSVAALGRHAETITRDKERASAVGYGSSYDVAIKLGAKILLLGVGNNRNSAIHYAEVVADLPYNDIPFREFWGRTALVERDQQIVEIKLANEFPACSANFGVADEYLQQQDIVTTAQVGRAEATLMDGNQMVKAVVERLQREPSWLLCDSIICEPCNLRKWRLKEKKLI